MTRRIEYLIPEISEEQWQVIGGFVRAAVHDVAGATPYIAADLLGATAGFVLWCREALGLKLCRSVVFRKAIIEGYIHTGCSSLSLAARRNRKTQLLRISEALFPYETALCRLSSASQPSPDRPYHKAEIVALRYWANHQESPSRRREAMTLLALCLGAGLSSEDMSYLTVGMVIQDELGIQIAAPGRNARVVPVLAGWEAEIVAAVDSLAPHQYLFDTGETNRDQDIAEEFLAKSSLRRLGPTIDRLKATWVVAHLAAGTPIAALMAAAGAGTLADFTRYVPHLPGVQPDVLRNALRGEAVW